MLYYVNITVDKHLTSIISNNQLNCNHTVINGELGYTLGREFNKHPLPVRYIKYTHGCICDTLSFTVGWSNTLKGVNTYGVHGYTPKGGTVIKHKSVDFIL